MLSIKNNSSGFTLIEVIIAMIIFGMMSIFILNIYFFTTDTSRKLNIERQIAESAREIIERVSEDIREKGMTGDLAFDPNYAPWSKYDYSGSGSEYLNLNNGRYVYGIKKEGGMDPCTGVKKTDPKIHCGLYFVEYGDNGTNGYNLVDSFMPEESKKRVKIDNLSFYISGDGINTSQKVMINLDLSLMQRNGISLHLIESSKLHIQTTISERSWKKH